MRVETIGNATLYLGDCRESMRAMPPRSVRACVTSPPYFGLRDYGHAGQIGLEATPGAFVAQMVEVFRCVREVLADDGTLWLNLGDSYNAHPGQRKVTDECGAKQRTNRGAPGAPSRHVADLKPKDQIGIPWRVAFALQADGWYLRQDIIWHKPNPMPESVTDRCTKAHEYIFLLSKSPRYYFDSEAIKEPAVSTDRKKWTDGGSDKQRGHSRRHAGFNGRYADRLAAGDVPTTRNRRDVWTVATKPFKGAHFATFPPELVEPCILAGSAPGDTVLDPFGGSGTTGEVALGYGRSATLCELNTEYMAIARARVTSAQQQERMFA